MRFHTSAAALLALACALDVHAAGFDCKAASTPSERTICADPALRQLDASLASAYANALAAAADPRDLRQQQRAWLRERERCGADKRCLRTHHETRIAALVQPGQDDMDALDTLRRAVEATRRNDAALALEKTLAGLAIKSGMTSFSNEEDPHDPGGDARFPRQRPAGVGDAEWRALLASRIDGGGEHGRADYTLLDIDGDGRRDLVIDTYTGGTGLFRSVRTLRQAGGKFVAPGASPEGAHLYEMGERGGNHGADWIRLHGRVYLAFRESQYGMDQLSLLRPWHGHGQVPRLTLRYRYRLAVPALQARGERPAVRLAPALHRALNDAVTRAVVLAARTSPSAATPICPLPANAPDDVREAGSAYGLAHYTFEGVADVAVRVGSQCYIGQLRDWFGAYAAEDGLAAEICMRKPEEPVSSEEQCYTVHGPREITGIAAGTGPF